MTGVSKKAVSRLLVEAGTVAAEALLMRFTVVGLYAAPLRVTVPVLGDPPVTLLGFSATDASVCDAGGGGLLLV